jgi:hypothetical protein
VLLHPAGQAIFGVNLVVNGRHAYRVALFWVVIVAMSLLILNCLLLIPIKSWLIVPASFISMFINIPWVAAKHDGYRYLSPDVCWPSWVMEFVYCGATVGMCIFLSQSAGTSLFAQVVMLQRMALVGCMVEAL